MKRKPLRLGSVSLLFAVILVCTALLALLGVMTARADWLMTEKYAQRLNSQYAHEAEAQEWLAQLDEALARGDELPEPAKWEDGQITALFEWQDGCRLDAALRQTGEGWQVVRWEMTMEWTENTDMGQLWEGPA